MKTITLNPDGALLAIEATKNPDGSNAERRWTIAPGNIAAHLRDPEILSGVQALPTDQLAKLPAAAAAIVGPAAVAAVQAAQAAQAAQADQVAG